MSPGELQQLLRVYGDEAELAKDIEKKQSKKEEENQVNVVTWKPGEKVFLGVKRNQQLCQMLLIDQVSLGLRNDHEMYQSGVYWQP